MAVISDIIDGDVTFDESGYKQTRTFLVTNVEGAAEFRLYNATTAPGIPQYGDLHPVIPNVIVTGLSASPEKSQNSIVRVSVSYEAPSFEVKEADEAASPTVQVGSSLTTSKTQKDNRGQQLTLTITTSSNNEETQTGEVDIQSPQTVIQFERKEQSSPLIKSLEYTGSVNKLKINSFNPRTLLCTGIEGSSEDNGITYSVIYRFQYKPDTWDATVAFIDPATDKIHVDANAETGNGVSVFEVYPEKDFRSLNLNL